MSKRVRSYLGRERAAQRALDGRNRERLPQVPVVVPPAEEAVATLTIRVGYKLNGTSVLELSNLLQDLAGRAAAEGLMTGGTPAETLGWASCVAWEHRR